jgi:hypothetical protein
MNEAKPICASTPRHPRPHDTGLDTIVPYRNGPAITGYYCAVFGLLPALGVLFAIAAVPMGVAGLHIAKREPHRKGKAHAWVAIILGSLAAIAQIVFVYWLIFIALPEIQTYT